MNIYTVTFFGHRKLPNMFALEKRLLTILRELIKSKEYVEFLVGRDGDFDQLAASTVRKAIDDYACGNASLILVLPYERAEYRDNRESYEAYYDEVEICSEAAAAHPKAAIYERNKSMVDRSDLVICAVEKGGGAAKAMKYAEKCGKRIINLLKK
ncbi:hypothetical protein [Ruminococcus albus]|uniref:Uncharacterized protein n=1 Tax=Ruminococcus albus (strain ATCC 27210 / DSM 20455 / JCM 14654 / NCDO 2250 / 7) TaxID=697329 RepID=E6UKU8_RUMA7|nr:hypothetical protein [Ruminococcus albus]ADU24294.1 hypothetical protein Rumal_3870 [Ruminococcus albus 7 = DSM 20455]